MEMNSIAHNEDLKIYWEKFGEFYTNGKCPTCDNKSGPVHRCPYTGLVYMENREDELYTEEVLWCPCCNNCLKVCEERAKGTYFPTAYVEELKGEI